MKLPDVPETGTCAVCETVYTTGKGIVIRKEDSIDIVARVCSQRCRDRWGREHRLGFGKDNRSKALPGFVGAVTKPKGES